MAKKTSRWLIWLHRLGYLTTAIIVIEFGIVSSVLGREWLRHRELSANLVERSRTQETPLRKDGEPYVRGPAVELFAKLPPLRTLHGDGLRFVAMPSFGTSDYALAVSLPSGAPYASGVLIVIDKTNESRTASSREFRIPSPVYQRLVADLDRLTDGWPGDDDQCLDGAPAAFERVRGARITSGIGNCSPHYDRVKLLVLNATRRFAPGPDLPTEDDWHRFEPEQRARRVASPVSSSATRRAASDR
ncbi:hypothetical protein LK533_12810 [Sphingomonas sp. PL-96]|uniref:hypothetical protein n=1 Tax=Sphingomonas sp. PL-96 TaxID=2887201 RepID=UPI001E2C12AC|nr:hypothetical protein [Sphingomonas sp. PL-96]MCC2977552.1 hypothetical protein [Sphingomonas sp. PL-96]